MISMSSSLSSSFMFFIIVLLILSIPSSSSSSSIQAPTGSKQISVISHRHVTAPRIIHRNENDILSICTGIGLYHCRGGGVQGRDENTNPTDRSKRSLRSQNKNYTINKNNKVTHPSNKITASKSSSSFRSSSKQSHHHRYNDNQDKGDYDQKRKPYYTRKAKKTPSLLSSVSQLASSSFHLSTQLAQSALQSTGKAAYHLITPKYISRHELYGVWRLDQVIITTTTDKLYPQNQDEKEENSISCVANIEFTSKGDAITYYNQTKYTFPFYFKSKTWPRSCTIEFQAYAFQHVPNNNNQDITTPSITHYYYKGYFRRKLADSSVIKIVGKIYQVEKIPTWKQIITKSSYSKSSTSITTKPGIQVGTFVARRRLSRDRIQRQEEDLIEQEEDEEEENGDNEEEWEEEEEEENIEDEEDFDENSVHEGEDYEQEDDYDEEEKQR